MRKEGESIKGIALILGVSKSSVSLWCRDIVLTEEQMVFLKKEKIKGGMAGRIKGTESNKKKKLDSIAEAEKQAKAMLGKVESRDLLIAGIALYWGEGSKAESTGKLGFSNSDPRMITFMLEWLQEFFNVSPSDLYLRIFINIIHQPRIEKVKDFRASLIGIERSCLAVTYIKTPQKKVYENYDSYYGVLSIRVKKGTFIRYKVLALISALILENDRRKEYSSPFVGVAKLVKAPHS